MKSLNHQGQSLLIVVLVIMALSAGAGVWLISGKWLSDESQILQTQAKLSKIASAISVTADGKPYVVQRNSRAYFQDVGSMPTTLDDLKTKPGAVAACAMNTTTKVLGGWCGPYWNDNFTGEVSWADAWGSTIQFSPTALTLTSYGPNRSSGGGDDIVQRLGEAYVTSGATFVLDAAYRNGKGFPATGCASNDLGFVDLSASSLLGALTNFSSCGASTGWNGTGTSADPYRLTFDGSNDYVDVPGITTSVLSSYSIQLWFNADSIPAGNGELIDTRSASSTIPFRLKVGSSTYVGCAIEVTAGGGLSYSSWASSTVSSGTWYSVACTYDSGTTILTSYINGNSTLGASGAVNTGAGDTSTYFHIGQSPTSAGELFDGSISQILFYNRVLTTSEITQNCNAFKLRYAGLNCT